MWYPPKGPGIVLMLVRVELEGLWLGSHRPEESRCLFLDRARIGTSQRLFDPCPAPLLSRGHATTAPAFAVGKAIEEVRPLPGEDMEEHGMILAVLEALKAVEGRWFA